MQAVADVPEVLEEYGELTRAVVSEYLRPREPLRHLYGLAADYPHRGGRMLRPSLCIATARVFGADIDVAVRVAAALELLHNAFLVHDDVEDESEERRGRPTLHAQHGVPIAVNVGDALALIALRALIDCRTRLGPRLGMLVLEETERMARESVEGQAIELGWREDNATELADEDYLKMVLKKTCWYSTIYPARAGALLGSGGERDLDRFVRFGFFLGAAFQIQDDILNLVGDSRKYGKEIDGDIREGKRTLMLIRLFTEAAAPEKRRLSELLAKPRCERRESDIAWVRSLMDHHECIEYSRRTGHALAGAAQAECERLYRHLPDSRDKRFIQALPLWVLERR